VFYDLNYVDFHEKIFYSSRSASIFEKSDIFGKKASALSK